MTMQLLDLPDELLAVCCRQANILDNKTLRLTCKRISRLASERVFAHLRLLPTTESATKAREVLGTETLNPLVRTITIEASLDIDTSLDDDEGIRPHWEIPSWNRRNPKYAADAEFGIEINGIPSATFKDLVADIGKFINLRSLKLKHNWEVCGPSTYSLSSGGHKEWTEYREALLKHLLRALNHPDHPAAKLRGLSICNQQDYMSRDIATSTDLNTVLSRLDSLELGIATEYHDAAPELEIDIAERHDFFGTDLVEVWLKPVQDNLVHLKLHSSCLWSFFPKCDLRGLRFPRLKSLALRNMTFTHDWQLDWIVAHGKTLESLVLDDCPIVHDITVCDPVNTERYPIYQPRKGTGRGRPAGVQWSHDARWHDYLLKLQTGLPNLITFSLSHGKGIEDCQSDCGPHGPCDACAYYTTEDHVTQAFEDSMLPQPRISGKRYAAFQGDWQFNDYHVDRRRDGEPCFPDCRTEDENALEELLATVCERRSNNRS